MMMMMMMMEMDIFPMCGACPPGGGGNCLARDFLGKLYSQIQFVVILRSQTSIT